MRVVTVSSSYGSGGSLVAPLVAQRLGVPFLARVLPARETENMTEVVSESPHEAEDLTRKLWERILDAFAAMPVEYGMVPVTVPADAALRVKSQAEEKLKSFAADPAGGVIHGWAGSAVLPEAFRVLLDGPEDRRVKQATEIEGVDEATAIDRLDKSGAIRRTYWKRLYNCDWKDPAMFNMCLDSTVLPTDVAADLIATAAGLFWDSNS